MVDLRDLLKEAAGPPPPPLEFDGVVRRARRRRGLAAAGVVSLVCVAVLAAVLVPFDGGRPSKLRTTPAERPDGAPADPDDGRAGGTSGGGGEERSVARKGKAPAPRAADGAVAPRPRSGAPGSQTAAGEDQIAFVRDTTVIVANGDGSGEVPVASNAGSPAWSPDGRRLAVVRFTDPRSPQPKDGSDWSRGHLAVMNADGTDVVAIRGANGPTNGYGVGGPAWSPDGSRIAFVQRYCGSGVGVGVGGDGCQWSEIRSIRPDGSDERVLASLPDHFTQHPSWSPDGRRFTFARARSADLNWSVYIANADGSSPVNITNDVGSFSGNPSWSPDGRWIAFTYSVVDAASPCGQYRSAISLVTPDGSVHPPVTDGTDGCDYDAAWSPDGTRLVFNRTRSPDHEHVGDVWMKHIEHITPTAVPGRETRLTSGVAPAVRPRPPA